MFDYHATEDFSRTVYTVDYDARKVCEDTLGDLCRLYAEDTTSPRGLEPKIHVRGTELWTWGHQGSFPKKLMSFDTEEEAEHGLLLYLLDELHTRDNMPQVFDFDRTPVCRRGHIGKQRGERNRRLRRCRSGTHALNPPLSLCSPMQCERSGGDLPSTYANLYVTLD